MKYTPIDTHVNFFKLEEKTLNYWKKNKIFEKSIERNKDNESWTFLDGPPFITGLPHYGSLLSSIPKDVFPRFWTMRGKKVRRVWGWDCHGLPAENKVQEKLGITRKKDIELKIGIKKFVEECKLYVNEVSSEWEWYINHIGRWVDFKNAYKTMDTSYMESVMWVFKQMYEKGAIYKGLRVSLYCPHCATPISNFEVAMDPDNYKTIVEPSTVYKFKLKNEKNTFLLAWSTTPWTKLVTVGLAINPNITYVKIKQLKSSYVLAKTALSYIKGKYTIEKEIKGKELIGKEYEPHYDLFKKNTGKRNAVVPADFVTDKEGTGIVTLAAYGVDDLSVIEKEKMEVEIHLNEEGIVKSEIPRWGNKYYLKINKEVDEDLNKRGLIYDEKPHSHTIPTCWRCHTRLYYSPQDAWYVSVSDIKSKLKETNKKINWVPKHFKHGRFEKSLEAAPDWCISRSRYWGSPVPVWECACGERFVPGSIAELEERSGAKIKGLHRPEIDEVLVPCKFCGKRAKRVPEVLDSWIEAGSASFAERHYPFAPALKLKDFFPPDFITEYTGQIRAWFYVLHVIANILFESTAYKNVLVTGVILGDDGRKMSKNYGNYPDPKEMIMKYGGDALRLYLMSTPVMHGEDILISEEEYKKQIREFMLILWNAYNFFVVNALADKWTHKEKSFIESAATLDCWILSRMNGVIRNVESAYEAYDLPKVISLAKEFVVKDFSGWYIRRSRERVGPTAKNKEDKELVYQTLWTILTSLSRLLAPLIPFLTEEIYRNLSKEKSVHLSSWWEDTKSLQSDSNLEEKMNKTMQLASALLAFRKDAGVKVKIPFKQLSYSGPEKIEGDFLQLALNEANIELLVFSKKHPSYTIFGEKGIKNQNLEFGKARELVREIQKTRKEMKVELHQFVNIELPSWPKKYENYIKDKALVKKISKASIFRVMNTYK